MAEKIKVGKSEEFELGKLRTVAAGKQQVVILRTAAGLCGVQNKCAHLPLPLSGGKVTEDNTIICPWHNSEYDMCTGENKDWVRGAFGVEMPGWIRTVLATGRKPANIKTYAISEENGEVFVTL